MKKIIFLNLVLWVIASGTDYAEGIIKIKGHATGALTMRTETLEVDFGNMRTYKGEEHPIVFGLKDDNLVDNVTLPAIITYSTQGLTNITNDYVIPVTVNSPEKEDVTNEEKLTRGVLTLDKTKANIAPGGEYIGELLIRAEYSI